MLLLCCNVFFVATSIKEVPKIAGTLILFTTPKEMLEV